MFDRADGFWFTDFSKGRAREVDLGGVYYAAADGSRIEEVVFPLHQPSAIAISAGTAPVPGVIVPATAGTVSSVSRSTLSPRTSL